MAAQTEEPSAPQGAQAYEANSLCSNALVSQFGMLLRGVPNPTLQPYRFVSHFDGHNVSYVGNGAEVQKKAQGGIKGSLHT